MVFEDNFFVETVLPKSIIRHLSDDELAMYRRPFLRRGPSTDAPVGRELPIEGEPADVVEIVEHSSAWLARSYIPKLFIDRTWRADHWARAHYCRTWTNQREVTVKGIHYLQKDSPARLAQH